MARFKVRRRSAFLAAALLPFAFVQVASQTPAPAAPLISEWWDVDAGAGFTCAIKQDARDSTLDGGTLWCWGTDSRGQVGNGGAASTSPQRTPLRISTDHWVAVSAGEDHACAIKRRGSLWCWGNGYAGKLGNGSTDLKVSPFRVGLSSDWRKVSAGMQHTCAIKTDGTLWCWGRDVRGRLGNGPASSTNRLDPVKITSETTWDEIAAGTYHTCGTQHRLPSTGEESGDVSSLWCWGVAEEGQLGIGSTNLNDSHAPVMVTAAGDPDWGGESSVTVGDQHTCAIKKPASRGSLWCWGSDHHQQLGDGGTAGTIGGNQYSPRLIRDSALSIGPGTSWLAVSSSTAHTCALDSGRRLSCWGAGAGGRLGLGDESDRTRPTRVGPSRGDQLVWVHVSAGWGHTCAIRQGDAVFRPPGTLACWGSNSHGQIGDGTSTKRLVPTIVIG
jgi:alpha-tubulin suppressor-like RCC1 family protein